MFIGAIFLAFFPEIWWDFLAILSRLSILHAQLLRKVHLSKKEKTPINRMEIQASLN